MLEALKRRVWRANRDLVRHGLVTLTWGNVSALDRATGLVVIKPSGVPYRGMRPEHMVVVDLAGRVVEGTLAPSTDTPTHLRLYGAFEGVGGIAHTHSLHATVFAQARRSIPCLGTTHADHFDGPVPVARPLTAAEVAADYEGHTGTVIVEAFAARSALACPAVLVAGHAPFTWGKDPEAAVRNSVALEAVAQMALETARLSSSLTVLEDYVLTKHHRRKHGPSAYYGQRDA